MSNPNRTSIHVFIDNTEMAGFDRLSDEFAASKTAIIAGFTAELNRAWADTGPIEDQTIKIGDIINRGRRIAAARYKRDRKA